MHDVPGGGYEMSRFKASIAVVSLTLVLYVQTGSSGDWSIGLESGVVFSGYNDVRIPNATGTKLSLSDDLSTDNKLYSRFTIEYRFAKRHSLAILFAPLSLRAEGVVGQEVVFDQTVFPENSALQALYKFNSYRMTYRYQLHKSDRLSFGFGFTAKIRDAAVVLSTDRLRDEYTNIGFVPLLNFKLEYAATNRLHAVFEGDALAAPQGRAEDISAMFYYQLSEALKLKGGYRVLEGGADVDDVYSFALLHYIAFGLQLDI
jgi:hypothetical protein